MTTRTQRSSCQIFCYLCARCVAIVLSPCIVLSITLALITNTRFIIPTIKLLAKFSSNSMHRYAVVAILRAQQSLEDSHEGAVAHGFGRMKYPLSVNRSADRHILPVIVPRDGSVALTSHYLEEEFTVQGAVDEGKLQQEENSVIPEQGMLPTSDSKSIAASASVAPYPMTRY